MLISEATKLANELMDKWLEFPKNALTGERIWKFGLDDAVRRFGHCKYYDREITLSRGLIKLNSEEDVRDVILHEIAHALSPTDAHHGRVWRENCLRVGARPESTYSSLVKQPKPKYKVSCANGHSHTRIRRINTNRYFCKCGARLTIKKI